MAGYPSLLFKITNSSKSNCRITLSKYLKSHPNRNTLVIGAGRELDDELGSGPLLGIVERTEPADDPDAVLAGRRLLLLGHGGGGEGGGKDGRGQPGSSVPNSDRQAVLFILPERLK
jgi:hypothetical protein